MRETDMHNEDSASVSRIAMYFCRSVAMSSGQRSLLATCESSDAAVHVIGGAHGVWFRVNFHTFVLEAMVRRLTELVLPLLAALLASPR
jgi:hypothetical protein